LPAHFFEQRIAPFPGELRKLGAALSRAGREFRALIADAVAQRFGLLGPAPRPDLFLRIGSQRSRARGYSFCQFITPIRRQGG
jgi:hypothetical protein